MEQMLKSKKKQKLRDYAPNTTEGGSEVFSIRHDQLCAEAKYFQASGSLATMDEGR